MSQVEAGNGTTTAMPTYCEHIKVEVANNIDMVTHGLVLHFFKQVIKHIDLCVVRS